MVAPKGVKDKLGQYWTTLLFACTYFPIAFTCILTLSPFGVRASDSFPILLVCLRAF